MTHPDRSPRTSTTSRTHPAPLPAWTGAWTGAGLLGIAVGLTGAAAVVMRLVVP